MVEQQANRHVASTALKQRREARKRETPDRESGGFNNQAVKFITKLSSIR